jgi:hypothetical protein
VDAAVLNDAHIVPISEQYLNGVGWVVVGGWWLVGFVGFVGSRRRPYDLHDPHATHDPYAPYPYRSASTGFSFDAWRDG